MEQQDIDEIKNYFKTPANIDAAVDLDKLIPLSLSHAKADPQLNRFFWLDENGPFSEITQRGAQSLRQGFYKLQSQPYYRTTFFPGTFAATVYYLNPENDNLIKYHANIGPLTNVSARPIPLNKNIKQRSQIPIIDKFLNDKAVFGGAEDYKKAKEGFYKSVYEQERIIIVHESIWDPDYPTINKRKQVTWSFLDF